MRRREGEMKGWLWLTMGTIATVLLFLTLLFIGAVSIPFVDTIKLLTGGEVEKEYWRTIVLESRLPMAIAATFSGASLSVAGLIMQTVFRNALAGPSVLGISSGASLGVAFVILSGLTGAIGGFVTGSLIIGALLGAAVTILILLVFSGIMQNGVMLLIVGLMINYLCNSLISLLNYFSPAEEIRSYLVWGLGSFSGLETDNAVWLMILCTIALLLSAFYVKPLNALLLGERYAASLGYALRRLRAVLLILTGLLVAVPTAFCGPIGFIGLVVPHLCRLLMRTSNHNILLPGCIVMGAFTSLLCALIGVLPSAAFGILPINVITPFIGVPVIIYLLVNRNRKIYV